MIEIFNQDILTTDNSYMIVHQVNSLGIMGGGLALRIKNKYPEVYDRYHKFCKSFNHLNSGFESSILGSNLIIVANDGKIFNNVIAQDRITGFDCKTNYDALTKGLSSIKDNLMLNPSYKLAIPYRIGCGLGGGDWDKTNNIIEIVFSDCLSRVKYFTLDKGVLYNE